MNRIGLIFSIFLIFSQCSSPQELKVGADRMEEYLPLLEGKRVALVVNQTSRIGETHLVDTLMARGINIVKAMSPEHGFRGEAPDGEHIPDGKDSRTGVPIISLYGKTKKPSAEQLADVDILLFDIQDVGVRFYTFISTMHLIMEAGAENDIKVIVLDRPNPNGMYVDGPVRDESISSMVAMHPIPLVHGLTVGELANMINREGWLANKMLSDLTVIPMQGWDHNQTYSLPVRPSPNLPNNNSIALYPSLGLFEGTVVSIGRGTDHPFEMLGHPKYSKGTYTFTPMPNAGSKYPPLEGKESHGYFFGNEKAKHELTLKYLLDYHEDLKDDTTFFRSYIRLLSGSDDFQEQVESGMSEAEIKATWQPRLNEYKAMRKKYLLYPDFD
jgi:uncharacterized protein YbbC (DUF1343 family)